MERNIKNQIMKDLKVKIQISHGDSIIAETEISNKMMAELEALHGISSISEAFKALIERNNLKEEFSLSKSETECLINNIKN